MPISPRAEKSKGSKQYTLPEPIFEVDPPLHRVKQETQEVSQDERSFESEELTGDGVLKIVDHDSFVSFRGSSIPLSTDFTERIWPLISNQIGLAHSRFRNDDQEQTSTVANENEILTNGSTKSGTGSETTQVLTIEKEQKQTHLSTDGTGIKVSTNREEGTSSLLTPFN